MQLSALRVRFAANDPDKIRVASGSSGAAELATTFGTGQDVVEDPLLLLLLELEHPLDSSEDADEECADERVGDDAADTVAGSFGGFRSFFGLVRELNGIGVEMELLLPLQQPLEEELLLLLLQGVESCCCWAASFWLSSLRQDSSSALAFRLVLSWLSSSKRWSGLSS